MGCGRDRAGSKTDQQADGCHTAWSCRSSRGGGRAVLKTGEQVPPTREACVGRIDELLAGPAAQHTIKSYLEPDTCSTGPAARSSSGCDAPKRKGLLGIAVCDIRL